MAKNVKNVKSVKSTKTPQSPIESDDPFGLTQMTRDQLKAFAVEKKLTGVKISSTKALLLEAIQKALATDNKEKTPEAVAKKGGPHPAITRCMGLVQSSFLTVSPWKNSNLIHEESGIIINRTTQRAITTIIFKINKVSTTNKNTHILKLLEGQL